jgi:hypothetical protein
MSLTLGRLQINPWSSASEAPASPATKTPSHGSPVITATP